MCFEQLALKQETPEPSTCFGTANTMNCPAPEWPTLLDSTFPNAQSESLINL